MSAQQYFIACCSTVRTKFKQLTCRHVYKEESIEFLEHETRLSSAGGMVEVDNYERNAYHMRCIKCDKHKIKVLDKLVHKLNVTDEVKHWKEQNSDSTSRLSNTEKFMIHESIIRKTQP